MFSRLSVFVGGFDLGAAEAVCGSDGIEEIEVVDLLDSLVDKSLVIVDDASGQLRYRMLETVRAFAAERLDSCGADPDGARARTSRRPHAAISTTSSPSRSRRT